MSNTPGISPLTTDLEDIRHSEDRTFHRIDKESNRPEIHDEIDVTDVRADRLPGRDSGAF